MTGALPPGRTAFAAVYEQHFDEVCRFVRALGAEQREIEDLAQEVFIVARRKYARFEGPHLTTWLYQIARRVAADARRWHWFPRPLARGDRDLPQAPDGGTPGTVELLEQREARRVALELVGRLSVKLRAVFVLCEFEGYSGEEIAALEQIPLATVYTRLHRARADFVAHVERWQRDEQQRQLPPRGPKNNHE